MQSLILPPAPFITTPQFGLPRLDPDPERIPLSRPRSTHARGYSPRALPPPRLMSGLGPKDDPLDVSGHARRQRHAGLEFPEPLTTTRPATTTATAATSTTVTPTATTTTTTTTTTTPPGPLVAPTLPAPSSLSSSHDKAQPPLSLHDEPSPRWPPPPYAFQGLSQPQEMPYPPMPVGLATSSSPGTATGGLSQKPTRRTKAHVASACVNCKKKHLGCDAARPCRRCVLSGKAATCVDVTHKKRGRPPLKAEDASVRQYTTRIEHPVVPGDHPAAQPRRSLHRTSGSREIRPMTDLQMPGSHVHPVQALAMGPGPGPPPPHRWSTSVYPHAVDPALAMPPNPGHRRFSSSGSLSSAGYGPMAETMSPVFGSRVPPMARPPSSYTTSSSSMQQHSQQQQQYPSNTSSPTYQHFYSGSPYMSRAPMPMGESPVSREHQGPGSSYMGSPVKLPPIFPPGPGPGPAPGPTQAPSTGSGPGSTTSPSGHRLSDHYPSVNWSPRTHHERPPPPPPSGSSTMPANAPPPQQSGFMDPVSPHTQQIHHHHPHHHLHHIQQPALPEFSYPQEYIQPPASLPRPPESVASASSYRRSIHMPSSSSTTPTAAPITAPVAPAAPASHARDEPPSSGADAEGDRDEGDRPTKRRKMALDDMVND